MNIEIVAPGGSFDKVRYAAVYGGDAVYFGTSDLSLRARSDAFTLEQLASSVDFLHEHGKKAYCTLNIFAHNRHLSQIESFLTTTKDIQFDAFIVADPGVLRLVRKLRSDVAIHLSTQANTTNFETIKFWQEQGVKRFVLARELTLNEITEIKQETGAELEIFVHGAMCVAYSGRCLLSNYFTQRDANLGDCAQSCRWDYSVMERTRPGEFLPVEENEHGTQLFSSRDMCLIEYIDQLARAGVDAFKIEGRMKSLFYVASVVRTYKEAVESYLKAPDAFKLDGALVHELNCVSHREYSSGFLFDEPLKTALVKDSKVINKVQFLAVVMEIGEDGSCLVSVRNKIKQGQMVEVFSPQRVNDFTEEITSIADQDGNILTEANPNMFVWLKFSKGKVLSSSLIRLKEDA